MDAQLELNILMNPFSLPFSLTKLFVATSYMLTACHHHCVAVFFIYLTWTAYKPSITSDTLRNRRALAKVARSLADV
jgi:hypothetical protein